MEEQPIDDLFRRKLYDAEIAPDHATWATLQGRQSDKRILSLWPYVAAAVVLILIGSFSWWALEPQINVANQVIATKTIAPTVASLTPRKQQEPAKADEIQKSQQLQPVGKISVHQAETETSGYRTSSVRIVAYKDQLPLAQQTNPAPNEVQISQPATKQEVSEGLLATATIKEVNAQVTLMAERTLVVSIAQPLPIVSQLIESEIRSVADSGNHRSGFGMLLRKAKKLKNGEIFALSNARTGRTNHRGIGKVFEEVKESIKNNSAD